MAILHPIYDYYKDNNIAKKLNVYDVQFHLNDNKELRESVQDAIIKFANSYGLGTSLTFLDLEADLYGIADQPLEFQEYSVFNLVEVAIKMAELLIARKSNETVPPVLKDICNRVGQRLTPQLNGGMYYETSDIFASMFWTIAFTEYQYEVKECKWCSAPLLTDVRASFCKAPRQCKNKFNNSRRPTKKGAK